MYDGLRRIHTPRRTAETGKRICVADCNRFETARKDIEGEITIDEAEQLIKSYYQSKEARTPEEAETHEADTASTNIRRLLTEKTFAFTLVGLTSIHRRIFDGVFKFAGQIRDYNITKK